MAIADVETRHEVAHRTRATVLIREVAASGVAAALAGLIAGGLGGRLAMRISALLNPSLAGVLSENGNAVGKITGDGTLELAIFGGLLTGMLAATAWVAIRPWLPEEGRLRYAGAATAAVGLTGFFVVVADNFDFAILRPAWVHVMMFTAIVGVAGLLTAWLDARLVARWSQSRPFTPIAIVILFLGVSIVPAAIGSLFIKDICFCTTPARPAGVLLVTTLLATTAVWVHRWRGVVAGKRLTLAGRIAATGAVAAGMAHLAGQIAAIV